MAGLPKAHPVTAPRLRSSVARDAAPASKKHPSTERTLAASTAKTHLLQLLDEVDSRREGVIITKRGRPVARLVPIVHDSPGSIFGCMKGTFKITGDIVGPEPDVWEAME